MTIQEAIEDLRSGESGRLAECLDTSYLIDKEFCERDRQRLDMSIATILSTRWITRDAR